MTEGDAQQFDDLAKQFEPTDAAREAAEDMELREQLSQAIERMDQEKLGRAIVTRRPIQAPPPTDGEQSDVARLADAITASKEGQQFETTRVGYILPTTKDGFEHLVVLKNGTMLVTEVNDRTSDIVSSPYKNMFAPNEVAYLPVPVHEGGVEDVASNFFGKSGFTWKVKLANTTPESAAQFDGIFDKAVAVATETKAERGAAKKQTTKSLLDKLDRGVFGKNELPPTSPPPADQPPPTQP